MKIFAASHVVPIASEAIVDGAVAIDAGEIVGLGQRSDLEDRYPAAEIEDLGEAAIMPGLVNCHAHLEITGLRGALDEVEHDFRSWLLSLNDLRSQQSETDIFDAAIGGATEAIQAGVTCFGDIGRLGHIGFKALKTTGVRGILFQETEFSPDVRTANADFKALIEKFERLRSEETELLKVGISPHSPYTVSSRLFELIAQFSIQNKVPISIHAAESLEEVELLTNGNGFFIEIYEKFGYEWSPPGCSPIHYLERLGVLAARPLLAHCVRVSDADVERIAGYGATIAHCPKSNAKFGHGLAPLNAFLDAGISVGLGSDSVASNNVCDLFEEARFAAFIARNHPESRGFLSAREMLELATVGGARALHMEDRIGTLEPAKAADIVAVSLTGTRQRPVTDIYAALVFSTSACDVMLTVVGGNEIYRRAD